MIEDTDDLKYLLTGARRHGKTKDDEKLAKKYKKSGYILQLKRNPQLIQSILIEDWRNKETLLNEKLLELNREDLTELIKLALNQKQNYIDKYLELINIDAKYSILGTDSKVSHEDFVKFPKKSD